MFVRGYGPASAQKETRIHPHARVPKTGWKYKGNGIRLQSPQDSAIAGPRFVLIFLSNRLRVFYAGSEAGARTRFQRDSRRLTGVTWGGSIPACSLALNFLIALRDLIVHDLDFQNQTGLVRVLFVSVE